MKQLVYHPLQYRDRWFAYLDLLGFTDLVKSKRIEQVIPIYAEALQRMHRACQVGKDDAGLLNSWFSDTFIIYSRSDSLQDFARVERASRIFFELLVMECIPVRGCISFGKLYAQAKQNIFVGPALIEAHSFGEALDWLGFCLAPSVERQLKNCLPLNERLSYRQVSDRNVLRKAPAPYLYAFAFNNGTVDGQNPYRSALLKMRADSPEACYSKYDNALAFLNAHQAIS